MTSDYALLTAGFWIGVIGLMVAYDLLKYAWKKWQRLEHDNLVSTRKAINAQCSAMVSELKERDNK